MGAREMNDAAAPAAEGVKCEPLGHEIDTLMANHIEEFLDDTPAPESREAEPIRMVLHCPKCHAQHIDEPDERTPGWNNPPHRSHLCHACGCIWRPADVPTMGVTAAETKGSADNWKPEAGQRERVEATLRRAADMLDGFEKALVRYAPIADIEEWPYHPEITELAENLRRLASAQQPVKGPTHDRKGLAGRLLDSASISTLPKWVRDLFNEASDSILDNDQRAGSRGEGE